MLFVTRSHRYKLRPTQRQSRMLMAWLALTRELYNAALQEKRDAWKKCQARVTMYDQMHSLAEIRIARPEFQRIPVVVLRGALRQLNRAFGAFFRRVKSGEKPGYPRFKAARRFNTISIDQLARDPLDSARRRLIIPLLGNVKVGVHRPLEGVPKTMRLTLANGRWHVAIQCVDVPTKPLSKTDREVGIDLGLKSFAVTSDGEVFNNPRVLRGAENSIARAQRRVAKRKRGSHRRHKAVRLLAKQHAHVRNVRRQGHIDVARALVARYDTICVEALNIKGLARSRLAKSVNDAGWASFLQWLDVKAEEAGREVVKVNPVGTTQLCSRCGERVEKDLSVRVHRCPCGLVMDRDVNAARNILARGRRARRGAPGCNGTLTTREVQVEPRTGHA